MLDVIEKINNVVWGWPALILLAATGVLMTVLASEPFFAKKGSLFLI